MTLKVTSLLELIRFPNLFTAVADVVAGILIVSGSHVPRITFLLLIICTTAIYAGGCVLNDLCDRRKDAKERPQRPIPSGKVSLGEARILLVLLFGLGLTASFFVGLTAFLIAMLLILLVILYDTRTKDNDFVGPANMGACRSLNLFLGMSPGISAAGVAFVFPLLSFVYVYSLTTLSRFEVKGTPNARGGEILGGWAITLAVVLVMGLAGSIKKDGLLFLALLGFLTGPSIISTFWKGRPGNIRRAVGMMIICLPLLDAAYTAGIKGWQYGLPVALCGPLAWLLARHFAVT
jgi:4-hydroxybenzoate polyprenyltransferase